MTNKKEDNRDEITAILLSPVPLPEQHSFCIGNIRDGYKDPDTMGYPAFCCRIVGGPLHLSMEKIDAPGTKGCADSISG